MTNERRSRQQGDLHDDRQYLLVRSDVLSSMLNGVSALECRCSRIKIVSVNHQAMASKITLGCHCGKQPHQELVTDVKASTKRPGPKGFELSKRLGAAMVEGAMGVSQLQDFLTVLFRRNPPSKRAIQRSV
jgi:hypothetical protein